MIEVCILGVEPMIAVNHLFDPRNLKIMVWMAMLLLLSLGHWVVRGIRVKRWMALVDVVKHCAPEVFTLVDQPTHFLWQKLLKGDLMTNDRFWFLAIWKSDVFPDDPESA